MADEHLHYFSSDTTEETINRQNAWNERIAGYGLVGSVVMGGLAWIFHEETVIVGMYPSIGICLWFLTIWENKRRTRNFWLWTFAWEKENERIEAEAAARRTALRQKLSGICE